MVEEKDSREENARKNRLSLLMDNERLKYTSLNALAKDLGIKGPTASKWLNGRVDPLEISGRNLRSLARIKGWTLEYLLSYFEGSLIVQEISFTRLKNDLVNLTLPEQAEVMAILSDSIQRKLQAKSSAAFTNIFNNFLSQNSINVHDAVGITGIAPAKRVAQLLDGAMPTQNELLKLSICQSFTKEDGSQWQLPELIKLAGI